MDDIIFLNNKIRFLSGGSHTKNIDNEINKLLDIKELIKEIEYMQQYSRFTIIPVSQCKYDKLRSNNKTRSDTLYYVIEPEIGQYIEGYIE